MPGVLLPFEALQQNARQTTTSGSGSTIQFVQQSSHDDAAQDMKRMKKVMAAKKEIVATPRISAVGLANLGNTCYLNSVLQCLNHTRLLREYLLLGVHSCQQGKKSPSSSVFCTGCAMQSLCIKMFQSGNGGVIYPKDIVANVKRIGKTLVKGRQEDAHEFMSFLLDKLCTAVGPSGNKQSLKTVTAGSPTSPIQRMFTGSLESQVHCSECRSVYRKSDPITSLSLDLNGKNVNSLSAAFSLFCKPEVLSGNNRYHCEKCKKHVTAQKRLLLKTLAPVLAIQLKRFGFGKWGQPTKLSQPVSFSETLDLSKHVVKGNENGTAKYSLYSVLVHAGSSCHSGHYFCFVKTQKRGWLKLDDSSVTPVSLETVLSQKAYILFYEREGGVTLESLMSGDKKKSKKNAPTFAHEGDAIPASVPKPQEKCKKTEMIMEDASIAVAAVNTKKMLSAEILPSSTRKEDRKDLMLNNTSKKINESKPSPPVPKSLNMDAPNAVNHDNVFKKDANNSLAALYGFNSTTFWIVRQPRVATPSLKKKKDSKIHSIAPNSSEMMRRIPTPPMSRSDSNSPNMASQQYDDKEELRFTADIAMSPSPPASSSSSPQIGINSFPEESSIHSTLQSTIPSQPSMKMTLTSSLIPEIDSWDTPETSALLHKRERLLDAVMAKQKRSRPDRYDLEYDAPKMKKIKKRQPHDRH